MNTHDIELPEHWQAFQYNEGWGSWEQVIPSAANEPGVVKAYTADQVVAAIEADRKRRGEPVPKGWKIVPETPTSKQIVHMACQIKGADADGWFRTDGDDWHQHVDAAERAYKWALSEAPQPAELVKGPSDQQLLQLMLGFGTHVHGDTTATFTGAELLAGCRELLARYGHAARAAAKGKE